ncbi:MAG: MFS transporter [Firmicutes bacterium]|nr:MFS transporter [Bacillota bacterium]
MSQQISPTLSARERRLIGLEYALIFMANGAMFPFFNLYLTKNLGWTGTRIGSLAALCSLLVMLTQPLWGRLSDASSKSKVLALALGGSSCLTILQPMVAGTSLAVFVTLRLCHAVFAGSIASMFDGIALDILGADRNTYGRYRLWGSLGFALAALIFGKVYEALGFTSMFFVYAVIIGGACCVVLRFDANPDVDEPERKSMQLGPVLANPALLVLLGGIFLVMTPTAAGENFLSIYLDAIGGSTGLTGYAFATMALAEVPIFLIAPWVIDRFGYKPVLVASTALFGLKLVMNALFPIPWLVILLQAMAGIGFALFQVSAVLMVDALVPLQFRSTGQAVLATVSWSLAGISGSLIFGRLLDTAGILAAFRIGGYVGLLGALFIQLFVPSGEKQQPSVEIEA